MQLIALGYVTESPCWRKNNPNQLVSTFRRASHLLGNRALVDEAVDAADVLVVAARAHNHLGQLKLQMKLVKQSHDGRGGCRNAHQKARPAEGGHLDGREPGAVCGV